MTHQKIKLLAAFNLAFSEGSPTLTSLSGIIPMAASCELYSVGANIWYVAVKARQKSIATPLKKSSQARRLRRCQWIAKRPMVKKHASAVIDHAIAFAKSVFHPQEHLVVWGLG